MSQNRTDKSIIQWNCNGIRSKKDEILNIINSEHPIALAIQEIKLGNTTAFNLPNYSIYRRDGYANRSPQGGVAIFIHQDIPHQSIPLDSNIQAIAVKIHINRTITLCSIYISRSHNLNEQELNQLLTQLPAPYILLGDFNSYSRLWGSAVTDTRGKTLERVMMTNNINILNDGQPTRISYNNETAIDLSICSPQLQPILEWEVSRSPLDSDHCPIKITIIGTETTNNNITTRYDFKNALWTTYKEHSTWNNINEMCNNDETNFTNFYNKLNKAAESTIPKFTPSRFFPKPWWCEEVKEARDKREIAYTNYRRNKSLINIILWKRARAIFKQLTLKYKKESWEKISSTLNINTPLSKVYENIRKIKGKKQRTIHILVDNNQQFASIQAIANKLADTFSFISSSQNYSNDFQQYRLIQETPLDFSSDCSESYNQPFSIHELQHALQKTKPTSPGPDEIHINMLKYLPENALEYFF